MLKSKNIINFDKKLSQSVLNDIISNKEINFKYYQLERFKTDINNIKKEYLSRSNNSRKGEPRYWHFWEIVSSLYKGFKKEQVLRKEQNISSSSRCNKNIRRTMFTKKLGFNPTILTLLVYHKEIKSIVTSEQKHFVEFKSNIKFWPSTEREKQVIEKCLSRKNVEVISNLCPDYEHKLIRKDLYTFTFNKLNKDVGLGGKRVIQNYEKVKGFFDKHKKTFTYDIFYGDFEGFSVENCKRLGINKVIFLQQLSESVKKIKLLNLFNKVGMLVDEFSNEKEWNKKKSVNKTKIIEIMNSNSNFRKHLFEISFSRRKLYKNWHPNLKKENYIDLLVDQGAEYATMGDMIYNRYKNPLIVGADHPRMKIFYYLNSEIPTIFLSKNY